MTDFITNKSTTLALALNGTSDLDANERNLTLNWPTYLKLSSFIQYWCSLTHDPQLTVCKLQYVMQLIHRYQFTGVN